MALARCILGKFLGVGCHCFPPPLDVPTFSARCLHVQRRERPPAAEGGTLRGREMFRQIPSRIRLPRNSRDLLHAANLRHGTDGFTSPPKEGVLRIFSPLKIRWLWPGLNPRTWVPKASMLKNGALSSGLVYAGRICRQPYFNAHQTWMLVRLTSHKLQKYKGWTLLTTKFPNIALCFLFVQVQFLVCTGAVSYLYRCG
jgi:hypothetical protein